MQSSIHGSCIIKEEIDIPFDQDNDNSFNEQSFCEKAVADRTADHDTNGQIKDAAFGPINIKTELAEDAIQLRWNNALDIYIRRIVEKPSDRPQSISQNWIETEEPQPEDEQLMETESEDEANVDVTADIDLEKLVNDMRMETGVVMEKPPAAPSNLELTEQREKRSMKIAKVVLKKLIPPTLVSNLELTKKEKTREKITVRTTEERRVLRERKPKNPDTEDKATKEKELREGKTEKTRSKESGKTHFSTLIKKKCPANCELTGEELQASKKCGKCQKPWIFVCVKCNKNYRIKQSITIHLDTKCHPRKLYSCELCEYESSNLSHVRRHLLNKHKAVLKKVSGLIQSTDLHQA